MENKYKIYPEYNFGVAKLRPGKHSFEDIYQFAKEFRDDKNFSTVHYMLTDLHNCKFNFEISKIKQLLKLVKEYRKVDNQKMGIYLLDTPMETAYSLLFFKALGQNRDYCFTYEKAYSLLEIPIHFAKFQELVDF